MTIVAGYVVHPAAELFPMMDRAEFEGLVADIEATFLRNEIVLSRDGRLLDGRNRALACERLGIKPMTTEYTGDDEWDYVVSANLHRRQLTDSQRAMVAAKLANRPVGNPQFGGQGSDDPLLGHMAQLPPSTSQAAAQLAVGETSVKRAKRVLRDGTPELAELVSTGAVPINTAARVAEELSRAQQDDYVDKVQQGADPVKAAPPKKPVPPPAPKKSGNPGSRRNHRIQLDAVSNGMTGYALLLAEITELDESVTPEEAARIRGDLLDSVKTIKRTLDLLKERSQ